MEETSRASQGGGRRENPLSGLTAQLPDNFYSDSSVPLPPPHATPSPPPKGKNCLLRSGVGHNGLRPVCPVQRSSLCSEPSKAGHPLSLQPPPTNPLSPSWFSSGLFKYSLPPTRMSTHRHPRGCYIDRKVLVPAPG